MWLKATTNALLVAGLVAALSFPWTVGARPAGRAEVREYLIRFGFWLLIVLGAFLGAAVCAILMIRKAREEYRAESRQNFDDLIESTLRTHKAQGTKTGE